tara:strand:+ start:674 stop:850 length:177 start_codon:yes stop_codon:yes gene_type:complete
MKGQHAMWAGLINKKGSEQYEDGEKKVYRGPVGLILDRSYKRCHIGRRSREEDCVLCV